MIKINKYCEACKPETFKAFKFQFSHSMTDAHHQFEKCWNKRRRSVCDRAKKMRSMHLGNCRCSDTNGTKRFSIKRWLTSKHTFQQTNQSTTWFDNMTSEMTKIYFVETLYGIDYCLNLNTRINLKLRTATRNDNIWSPFKERPQWRWGVSAGTHERTAAITLTQCATRMQLLKDQNDVELRRELHASFDRYGMTESRRLHGIWRHSCNNLSARNILKLWKYSNRSNHRRNRRPI